MSTFAKAHGLKFQVEKPVRDALAEKLRKPAQDGGGTVLDEVLDTLIALAKTGDWRAMMEIFDRMDGRADAVGEAKPETGVRLVVTGVPFPRATPDARDAAGNL